jgi:hypothetical protein
MLTAFAICYFLCEVGLAYSVKNISGFLFLIILAAIVDYGIWELNES